jgi:hypothetical protein
MNILGEGPSAIAVMILALSAFDYTYAAKRQTQHLLKLVSG